ncbi:uncharacterized protein LOC116344549 [Contarinia nasturtii]|uniref:uncharacterized protein LOC116344549 n=1 Tax=Contarinia nasturtii TaxID=265458 RepID=UPI0012D4336F|nr:uncharacterized protein LOC116344549 [Contarinia nasturtii]
MNVWTLWIITVLIALGLTKAKDDIWQGKIPIKFLKAVMEQPTLCESGYSDYESCENAMMINSAKSRSANDAYEYNSDEVNIEKIIEDLAPSEEKRSNSRAGCDCQLSSEMIDLGPSSFPRLIRNVTCDRTHKRCYHSRGKELRCLPIPYKVSVIKMRDYRIDPRKAYDEIVLPQDLRCCWKADYIPTIVGCVCGPDY